MTDILITIAIIGTIIGTTTGILVISNIQKRLVKIEKFIGKTNNLNKNK